jgi:hypothetical protein
MSEESSPSEPKQQAPSKKKVTKTTGKTEPAAAAKVPATKAGKSRKEEITEKPTPPNDGSTASSEARPAIKRGVRGAKKAAKKEAPKDAPKETSRDAPREAPAKKDVQPSESKDPNQSPPSQTGEGSNEPSSQDDAPRKQARRGRNRNRQDHRQDSQQQDGPKIKLDAKMVAKRAWKIFLSEVSEEGLALIADKDAREFARRSLRVAEIYSLEEEISLQKGASKNER